MGYAEFYALAVACKGIPKKTPGKAHFARRRMHWQSTFDRALRLHSCRALSSQSHINDKPKMAESKKILTNHIPAQLRTVAGFAGEFFSLAAAFSNLRMAR